MPDYLNFGFQAFRESSVCFSMVACDASHIQPCCRQLATLTATHKPLSKFEISITAASSHRKVFKPELSAAFKLFFRFSFHYPTTCDPKPTHNLKFATYQPTIPLPRRETIIKIVAHLSLPLHLPTSTSIHNHKPTIDSERHPSIKLTMSSAQRDPLSVLWTFEASKEDILELCKLLWPTAQHKWTSINVLSLSVNRCFAIDITEANSKHHRFVLRYPQKLDTYKRNDNNYCTVIKREVCVLKWLETNAPESKAPQVVVHDDTHKNPIRMPYMVMRRFTGQPLNEILLSLTDDQRLDLAYALGHWFNAQRSVTMPRAGIVNAAGEVAELDNSDSLIAIQPFGMSDIDDMLDAIEDQPITGARIPPIIEEPHLHPMDMLNAAFFRRLANTNHTDDPEGMHNDKLDHCRLILDKLVQRGLFRSDEMKSFSLCHTDLFPRNIIVDLSKTGKDIISGIVDWDCPIFAPSFMSCMPPAWLWAPETYVHREGDFIGIFGHQEVKPESEFLLQVKFAFEDKAGEFYVNNAYNREMAAGRIFMDFVQARDWRNHPLFARRNEFVDEWMQLFIENRLPRRIGPVTDF